MDMKTAIAMFAQGSDESLCEAWERYKSLLRKCPKHVFDDTTQIHMFRGGLLPKPKLILDAAAHGLLMALSPNDAVDIINDRATTCNNPIFSRFNFNCFVCY